MTQSILSISNLYGAIGRALKSLGRFKEASAYQREYLAIAKKTNNTFHQGQAYGNLGNVYLALGQYQKALECQNTYLTIAATNGDRNEERVYPYQLGKCVPISGTV